MAQPSFHFVHTPSQLNELLPALERAQHVAFDTEFVSEGSYEPILCLIQLATTEGLWIVDPLAVGELRPLFELVTAPEREMVALAAREEIRFCLRYAERAPARLLDPQIAAGLLGYGYPLSHTNLVKKALNVNVAGGEAFTDWRKRPLTERQLAYASDDVRYLLQLRERLLKDAERRGRTAWAEAECRRLVERVVAADSEERWRVAGSAGLGRRDLAVLREVWRWRDGLARRTNTPARRIMRDDLLIEIARRKPPTTADLTQLRGLERNFARDSGPRIVDAVQLALQLPDSELPRSTRRDDPPQVGVLTQFLSLAANGLAAENEVDPALLATTAELQDLVRWKLGRGDDEEPPLLQGWRGEILGQPLLEILEGKRRVRVRSLKSPNPLVFEAPSEA
jgi:ribonuclease D